MSRWSVPEVVTDRVGVRQSPDGGVVYVTVGDGHRRNALRSEDWLGLGRLARRLSADETVSAVVVEGTGNTFCAGSDIREWAGSTPAAVAQSFDAMETAMADVEDIPVPVVAAIAGVAAGAGCQLALACDLRVLTSDARIGMPIARLGILSSPSFARRLVTVAGGAFAKELLLSGDLLTADQALARGLATAVVPRSALRSEVTELLGRLAEYAPSALRAAKRAVNTVTEPLVTAASATAFGEAVDFDFFQQRVGDFLSARKDSQPASDEPTVRPSQDKAG